MFHIIYCSPYLRNVLKVVPKEFNKNKTLKSEEKNYRKYSKPIFF